MAPSSSDFLACSHTRAHTNELSVLKMFKFTWHTIWLGLAGRQFPHRLVIYDVAGPLGRIATAPAMSSESDLVLFLHLTACQVRNRYALARGRLS
jgi:hypothetical protein